MCRPRVSRLPPPRAGLRSCMHTPGRLSHSQVVIHGLTSEAGQKLNGLEGKLSGFNEAKERYDVTLEDGKVVSCKLDNLIDIGQHKL